MNPSFGIRIFKGLLAVGGVLSAIVASPIMFAAGASERFSVNVSGVKSGQDMDKIRNELKKAFPLD